MDDSHVLDPGGNEVAFGGEKLKVTPLKVGQIPAFTRVIKPIFSALDGLFISPPGEAISAENLEVDAEKVLALITEHGEALIEAAAIAVRKPKAFIEEGTPGEFVHLVRTIIDVNVDFFGQAVAKGSWNRPTRANGAGLTRSSS